MMMMINKCTKNCWNWTTTVEIVVEGWVVYIFQLSHCLLRDWLFGLLGLLPILLHLPVSQISDTGRSSRLPLWLWWISVGLCVRAGVWICYAVRARGWTSSVTGRNARRRRNTQTATSAACPLHWRHSRSSAVCGRQAQSRATCLILFTAKFQFTIYCWCCYKPSVLWRCWLGGRKGIRPVKTEWWGASMVICLERGADLHTAQLMTLPLTVSCFSKIQIGFTFLVPAHPGSPRKRAVKRVCVNSRWNQSICWLFSDKQLQNVCVLMLL